MRVRIIHGLVVGLVGLSAVAAAPPVVTESSDAEVGSPVGGSPEGGGFTSDNVEWLDVLPRHTGTAGGTLHGTHYYLTDPRGVFVYDVSEPGEPKLAGSLTAQQMGVHAVLAQEKPDTNGELLLVDAADPEEPSTSNRMLVVDVGDPANPRVVGSIDVTAHTWTCVLDCTYAYGRDGPVIDLREPADPKVAANWRAHVDDDDYMHHFTEVAPGRLIGAGQPAVYLDATDPENPEELARIDPGLHTLGYHGAEWPNEATDPLMLMGAEIAPEGPTNLAGSGCNDESAHAVATYDATEVRKVDEKQFERGSERGRQRGKRAGHDQQREAADFTKLSEWRVDGRGAYADGHAPAHTLFCGHWFDPHPQWEAGGLLAIAHYDWGTRVLDVASSGEMREVGWWQPIGGYTGAANWISDEVVYVHDYRRGLDILRVTDPAG